MLAIGACAASPAHPSSGRESAASADAAALANLADGACRGITVWGISDRFSRLDTFPPFDASRPNAPLLIDHEMRRKPAYLGFVDALRQAPESRKTLLP